MSSLKGKTILITGSSRGIGYQMAIRFAKDGANVAIIGKTAEPDPRMPGTIYSAAEDVEAVGGKALPLQVDLCDDEAVNKAVMKIGETFGGIDILVINASALEMTPSILDTPMKRFDLVFGVNVRGAFASSRACIPSIQQSSNPHILIVAPPLQAIRPKWFKGYNLAYTISKFGMSLCALGLNGEFAEAGIGVNTLWPKYVLQTSAARLKTSEEIYKAALHPSIMADAAYHIVTSDSKTMTGNFFLDADLLAAQGQGIEKYMINPEMPPIEDFFID